LIAPVFVTAGKSGAVSPSCNAMITPRGAAVPMRALNIVLDVK
jgi:hypothetical protein